MTDKISIEKDCLVFASGHFITYEGRCETLHGHNCRARVELEGELDHRMLLPRDNPALQMTRDGDSIEVLYKGRRYVFPQRDVVLLPIPNTTAEMLARYLARQVKEELLSAGAERLSGIVVEVEESFGQSASYAESIEG
jgi:6-pyruvoyltetrahydropterin/6-carboxytetrahydropterin synthase